jgi:hypothetical protein
MKPVLERIHPKVKEIVLNVLKKHKINTKKIGLCGQDGNFPFAEMAAVQIMQSVGLSFEQCNIALNGVPPQGCDTEFNDNYNWSNTYNGYMLQCAIEFANDYFTKSSFFEVGMKYPTFRKDILVKKFKLTHVGTFEPEYSKERSLENKTFYEVWQDAQKNYTFSFEKDRMGKGGYAGLVVKTVEEAINYCKWYLSKKSFYIKDMDIFINRLGGFNKKELKALGLL